MKKIKLFLFVLMLLVSGSSIAATSPVRMKERPSGNLTHGATRIPSVNRELQAMFEDEDSELTFFYIIGEQTFSYVLYNVEDGTRVCGDGVFDVDGVYSLSTSGLSSGIYNIEISIGSVVYQGEFEIE